MSQLRILRMLICSLISLQAPLAFCEYRTGVMYAFGTMTKQENSVYTPTSNAKYGITTSACTEFVALCAGLGFGLGMLTGSYEYTQSTATEDISTSIPHYIRYQLLTFYTEIFPLSGARQWRYLLLDPFITASISQNRYSSKLLPPSDIESAAVSSNSSQHFSYEYGAGFEWILSASLSMQIKILSNEDSYLINDTKEKISTQFYVISLGWTRTKSVLYRSN